MCNQSLEQKYKKRAGSTETARLQGLKKVCKCCPIQGRGLNNDGLNIW